MWREGEGKRADSLNHRFQAFDKPGLRRVAE
jgi:hypothetical protein